MQPLTLSPAYLEVVRGSHALAKLIAEGKDDSPEADAIRDASDKPWQALSEAEREQARRFAEKLYSVYGEPSAAAPPTREGLEAARQAKSQGACDRTTKSEGL